MTNREITSLAFKIFAIYILLVSIQQFSQLHYLYSSFFPDTVQFIFLVPILIIILLISLAFMLWKLSNNVFNTMVKDKGESDDLKVDQPFILNIVGFYLLFHGLLELGSSGISLIMTQGSLPDRLDHILITPEHKYQSVFYAVGSFIKVIIALTLILRSKGWVKLFQRIRHL